MILDFTGQVVGVTGAGTGVGRAIALAFAREGARVHATDIDPAGLAETAALARVGGMAGIATATADLRDRAAGARWIAGIEQQEGKALDVLVNNAGGTLHQPLRPIEEVPDSEWDDLFAANVSAIFGLCRAAVPAMKRAGRGRIVTISSGAGIQASYTGIQGYTATKHAVVGLTRQLAQELGRFGITVNSIAPGFMMTNHHKQERWDSYGPEKQQEIKRRIFLGRLGTAEDVARLTLFLASDLASFLTGHVLPADGGR